MRFALASLAVLVLLAATPVDARAEEVFVLDNGTVLRGTAVHEDADRVVVRLSNLAMDNRITVRPGEIRQRYVTVDPKRTPHVAPSDAEPPVRAVPLGDTAGTPRTIRYGPEGWEVEAQPVLPEAEPDLEREGWYERLERVTRLAFPGSLEGRLLVGFLLLVVLTILVAGCTRLLGMKAATLHASTTLGMMLGVFLLGDILLHGEMLRADRALWILPLQMVIWLGTARALLDAPLSRTVPLFAMVLFMSTCFVFATGSVLVSA